jgi:hypothetical protein
MQEEAERASAALRCPPRSLGYWAAWGVITIVDASTQLLDSTHMELSKRARKEFKCILCPDVHSFGAAEAMSLFVLRSDGGIDLA